MKERKNILEILYNSFDRLPPDEELVLERFYIESDGEMIPIAQHLSGKYRPVLENIKKLNKSTLKFSMAYQGGLLKASHELSGSALKILLYMVSIMQYKNTVFDFKYADVVERFSMSYSTVTKAVKELSEKNYIKVKGKRTAKVYHVSPAIFWKGSIYSMHDKLKMFVDED